MLYIHRSNLMKAPYTYFTVHALLSSTLYKHKKHGTFIENLFPNKNAAKLGYCEEKWLKFDEYILTCVLKTICKAKEVDSSE